MVTLKAKETLSLEGGRVSPGGVFQLRSKEEAAILIAQDRAEETSEKVADEAEPEVPAHISTKAKTK